MKNKKVIFFLVLILSISLAFIGCGKGDTSGNAGSNKKKITSESAETKPSEKEISKDEGLAAAAKEESVSVKEMQRMIEELTVMEAEKYSVTVEEYTKTIGKDGLTPFTAQKQVSDTMGITITELYKYQSSNRSQLTDEQKENNANMAKALKEIEDLDLSAGVSIGSGDLREVTGDVKELLLYKASEVVEENEEDKCIEIKYHTEEDVDDVIEYFETLLKDTEGYMLVDVPGLKGGIIEGSVSGYSGNVTIEKKSGFTEVSFYFEK